MTKAVIDVIRGEYIFILGNKDYMLNLKKLADKYNLTLKQLLDIVDF